MASEFRAQRRLALRQVVVVMGTGFAGLSFLGVRPTFAQNEQMTVSGGGVNVKQMPAAAGDGTVAPRESFSFDTHYAQCIVEDNPAAFAMDTYDMGRVVIAEHSFFMAMYSTEMGLVSIKRRNDGKRVANLSGQLGCATEAGTGDVTSARAMRPNRLSFRSKRWMGDTAALRLGTASRSRCTSTRPKPRSTTPSSGPGRRSQGKWWQVR
jgi:hypothetical protein